MEIKIAENEAEILSCFDVLQELRPHLCKEKFVATIGKLAATTNFKLVYLTDSGVKAVAGIRISEWLYSGRYLEIEDLITTQSERSKGYGGILFDWLHDYAITHHCDQLRLVSGVARESAHRFYLRKGMIFEAKYFSMNIK
ncbi:MAG: GNAT family N-acetyltransferase [Pseudomonadota bacterium]